MTSVERLQELLTQQNLQPNPLYGPDGRATAADSLPMQLQLVANLIITGFGTRIFYVVIDGFDTHSTQADAHRNLLAQVSDGISNMFSLLKNGGNDKRVLVMTFSEFGRRVQENGSKGTDHGAASCLFVAGPALKGGIVGEHPSLKDLDSGDLKYALDFRRVYATLLDDLAALRQQGRPRRQVRACGRIEIQEDVIRLAATRRGARTALPCGSRLNLEAA